MDEPELLSIFLQYFQADTEQTRYWRMQYPCYHKLPQDHDPQSHYRFSSCWLFCKFLNSTTKLLTLFNILLRNKKHISHSKVSWNIDQLLFDIQMNHSSHQHQLGIYLSVTLKAGLPVDLVISFFQKTVVKNSKSQNQEMSIHSSLIMTDVFTACWMNQSTKAASWVTISSLVDKLCTI